MDILKFAEQPPATINWNESLGKVIDMMVNTDSGAVIVTENGEPVGIFTRRDVIRLIQEEVSMAKTAAEIMSTPVTVLERGTEINDAIEKMTQQDIHHLPVVDENGRVLGVIDTSRALKRLVARLTSELDSLEAYVGADGIGG